MQGRLSVQNPRAYQAFPEKSWAEEFRLAGESGFQHIEWVLESHRFDENPLFVHTAYIAELSISEGVTVPSLCADFLMDSPLSPGNQGSWRAYEKVIDYSERLGIHVIVIPCVDSSSLLDPANLNNLRLSLPKAIELADRHLIKLALETDLPPAEFSNLLSSFDTPSIGVNYDSGNSASLGYDFEEEMTSYGDRITDFHVKDRIRGGQTVKLGQGAADFPKILNYLSRETFTGIVTMQAWRDEDGVPSAHAQLAWLNEQFGAMSGDHV